MAPVFAREAVAAVEALAARMVASAREDDRSAGTFLQAQIAAVAAGTSADDLTARLTRTLSTSADDEEWAETTLFVEARLSPALLRVTTFVNQATMIGAAQTDVTTVDGRRAPVDADALAWWREVAHELLAHPDHRAALSQVAWPTRLVLRDEEVDGRRDVLTVWFDADGDLHVEGAETRIVRAAHVGTLLDALGRWPDQDELDVLRGYASSSRSRVVEQALALRVVPSEAATGT